VLALAKRYMLCLVAARAVKNTQMDTHPTFFVWQYLLMGNFW